jgi:hypothetical protein
MYICICPTEFAYKQKYNLLKLILLLMNFIGFLSTTFLFIGIVFFLFVFTVLTFCFVV